MYVHICFSCNNSFNIRVDFEHQSETYPKYDSSRKRTCSRIVRLVFLLFSCTKASIFYFRENQDQEKLLGDSEQDSSGEITPNSDFQIRNRYLSRIGAPVNIKDVSYLTSELS